MMTKTLPFLLLLVVFISCDRIKNKTKETINQSGEVVGKSAAEFFEGVSEGVEVTIDCDLILSEEVINEGVSTGKYSVGRENSSNYNKLTVYFIFEKDIKTEYTAIVDDKNGLEIGRTKLLIEGLAGETGYFDFVFDERTNIEVKSSINIK
jgi:hypothetical protein